MDITIDELAAVLPKLSITAKQEIHIHILEMRIAELREANEKLGHHITVLETQIKEQ
jgi:FtsZ-binding cell division protein ZapB